MLNPTLVSSLEAPEESNIKTFLKYCRFIESFIFYPSKVVEILRRDSGVYDFIIDKLESKEPSEPNQFYKFHIEGLAKSISSFGIINSMNLYLSLDLADINNPKSSAFDVRKIIPICYKILEDIDNNLCCAIFGKKKSYLLEEFNDVATKEQIRIDKVKKEVEEANNMANIIAEGLRRYEQSKNYQQY